MATEHPEEFLPNAFIQTVAYRGTERNAMYQMDAVNIVGPLDEQVIRACKFVQRNMRIMAYKDPGRVDVPQYSLFAVFEAVVNAVATIPSMAQRFASRCLMTDWTCIRQAPFPTR